MRRRRDPHEQRERVVGDRDRARAKTFERAARLLAAKPRSVRELRERLLEKPWTDGEIVDAVITRLRDYGYLDDDQYARDVALSKLRQKPQGRRRLQYAISQKKL
jgi:regulatory protein